MQAELPKEPILDSLRMRYLLRDMADQRGKIARMLGAGMLVSLRRGLYASRRDLNPLCAAGPIYGPSYISFESALSWHGLIPERVVEILSATVKRATVFENDFGRYRYLTIPKPAYPIGVMLVTEAEVPFLIATPTKALADRVAREADFRSMAAAGRWLRDMRIEPSAGFDHAELTECANRYGRPSVRWLLRYLEKHKWIES